MTHSAARVRLYIDESYTDRNERGDAWLYICVVAIPETVHQRLLDDLLSDRASRYDGEIHFKDVGSHYKHDLASRWLDRVLLGADIRFHVLGIHLNRIEKGFFGSGGSERAQRIYKRFFRPAITYPLKAFFGESVEVSAVFHDKGAIGADPIFDWHSLWRIAQDHPQIKFAPERVAFVDSDHRREKAHPNESHFIQVADLVAGSVRSCLDGRCTKKEKRALALQMLPLVERMTSGKRNIRSRYRYVDRCSVSFFPSKTITMASDAADEWARLRSGFYSTRELLIVKKDQMSLFGA